MCNSTSRDSDALAHIWCTCTFISLNEWLKRTYTKCASVSLQVFMFSRYSSRLSHRWSRGYTDERQSSVCAYRGPVRACEFSEGIVFLCSIPENKAWTVWDACIHCSELNLKFLDFQRTFSYVDWHSTSRTSKTLSFSCCRTCPVFLFQIFLIGSFKFRFFFFKCITFIYLCVHIPQWTYGGRRTACRGQFSSPTMLVLGSKLRSSAFVLCLYALSHFASLSPIYKWNFQRYLFVVSQVCPDSTWWSWKVSPGRWNSELSQHYLSNLANEFRLTVPLVLMEPRNQGLRAGASLSS